MKSTLVRPARWQDRVRLHLKGYLHKRPEGPDGVKKCPSCGAKAYGKGKSRVSSTYERDTYETCMACGFNPRFGPQGPPPDTLIDQQPNDPTRPLAAPQ